MNITAYIKQDLKRRIGAGEDVPAKLTLADLAAHYRVSFTPVRRAVDELIHERFLEKKDNGRLAVVPQKGRRVLPVEEPAAPRDWERELALDVIRQSLRGEGDYLREEATAEKYEVGRTVIRQAFSRLAGKGLLEHVPRCGWRVRSYDEADMLAYLEVREMMELKALDLARPNLTDDDLQRMLAGNAPAAGKAGPRLDNDLHRYLIAKAGNLYIRDFFDRHGVYYTTLFDHAALGAETVAEMASQHREILRAMLEKDWRKARQALSEHIRAQAPVVKMLMAKL